MSLIKSAVRRLLRTFKHLEAWAEEPKTLYIEPALRVEEGKTVEEIYSLWDYLAFKENTQAFHLTNVVGFDEWVDMGEIRRRISELFQINYKNERSLYPYLKTLVDIGLVESTSIGGRMRWRKKDLIIKIKKVEKEKEKTTAKQKTS
jgi:hypothetical protein